MDKITLWLSILRSCFALPFPAYPLVSWPQQVVEYDLTADDKFLVLASDGVWEFVSCEDSVAIVQEEMSKAEAEAGKKESSSATNSNSNAKPAATPAATVTAAATSGVTAAAAVSPAVSATGTPPPPAAAAAAAAAAAGGGKARKGKRQGPGNPLEAAVKRLMTVSRDRWLEKDQGAYVDDITAVLVAFTHHEV